MAQSVSALNNMSMALYGTPFDYNQVVPNGAYGYNAYQSPYMNPGVYNNQDYYTSTQTSANTQTPASAVSQDDLKTLSDYYCKNLEPSESLKGAAMGGAAFGVLMHPRLVVHPWNSLAGLKDVSEMFKGVRTEGSALNKLWKENNGVMREAYFQMHKAASRANSKLGVFRKRYSDEEYKYLKNLMDKAIKSGNIEEIAKASETLKSAYVSNGAIPRGWQSVKKFLGFESKVPTAAEGWANTAKIAEGTKTLLSETKGMTFMKALKHGGGVKGGLFFMGIELLMGLGKISTAFSKDSSTGMKQLGQTLFKGAGSAVGWAAGEALGVWGMAALGAKIGTMFGPGIGTAIGGLAGILGGSIGCWLTGKATKAIVGEDVANNITAQKMTKTPEGQVQLLSLVEQKINAGEQLPQNVMQAAQNVATALA